jgi:hypothetical protein
VDVVLVVVVVWGQRVLGCVFVGGRYPGVFHIFVEYLPLLLPPL